MKTLITSPKDGLSARQKVPLPRGRPEQSLFSGALLVAFTLASFAAAEPITVLYWDGTSLISEGAGAVIPATATYALDEMDGVGIILAAMPNASSPPDGLVPGQNVSAPSIQTPNGTTFEIPDAGNIANISSDANGNVTVTYKDGSTATTPGTYVPPGSAPPAPPAPANGVGGPLIPGPEPNPIPPAVANDLVNDAWVAGFLGGALKPANLPPSLSFFDTTVDLAFVNGGNTDTIVQRLPVPEHSSTLVLLGIAVGILLTCDWLRQRVTH